MISISSFNIFVHKLFRDLIKFLKYFFTALNFLKTAILSSLSAKSHNFIPLNPATRERLSSDGNAFAHFFLVLVLLFSLHQQCESGSVGRSVVPGSV